MTTFILWSQILQVNVSFSSPIQSKASHKQSKLNMMLIPLDAEHKSSTTKTFKVFKVKLFAYFFCEAEQY